MRGEVFHYDQDHDYGYVNGVDGKRYIFSRNDLAQDMTIARGMLVEFTPDDGAAHEIVAAKPAASSPSGRPERSGQTVEIRHSRPMGLWAYFLRAIGDDYRNFAGRACRKEFWAFHLWFLVMVAALFGFGILLNLAINGFRDSPGTSIGYIPAVLFVLAAILPSIAVVVRRLHDIGLTGWLVWLCYIPAFGAVAFLIFGFLPSQPRQNRWGSMPAKVRFQRASSARAPTI